MIANFALTRLVIRKDDRWNRNVLRILKQGEQYQFNGYGDGRLKGISLLRG